MTIDTSDLVLRHSQRQTDTPDGGGAMTANEVVLGDINSLFPPLSRADRVSGEVALRKVFLHCGSSNTDTLYGANMLLSDSSDDDQTDVFMMPGYAFDRRDQAVEQLMQAAVASELVGDSVLYGDQFAGAARLLVKTGVSIERGDVLYIELDWIDGLYVDGHERRGEYVQVDRVDQVDGYQEVFLTSALRADYPESLVTTIGSTIQPAALRRTRDNSGAGRFYGRTALSGSAVVGDRVLSLTHDSVQVLPMAVGSEAQAESVHRVVCDAAVTALGRAEFVADGYVIKSSDDVVTQYPLPVPADTNLYAVLSVAGAVVGRRAGVGSGLSVNVPRSMSYGSQMRDEHRPFVVSYCISGGRNKLMASGDLVVDGGFISGVAVPDGGLLPKSFVMSIDDSADVVTDDGAGRLVRMDSDGNYTALLGFVDYQTGDITSSDPLLAGDRVLNLIYAYGVDLAAPLQTVFAVEGAYTLPFAVTATRISDGATLTATVEESGVVGDAVGGVAESGGRYLVSMAWSDEVFSSSISTGEVSLARVTPVDPDAVGLDAVRMPVDGRVPIIQGGDWLTLHDTQDTQLVDVSAGAVTALPRNGLNLVQLHDAGGVLLDHGLYAVDLDGGSVTIADPVDLSGYALPISATHVIEENVLCQSIDDSEVTLGWGLQSDWLAGSAVSSVLRFGDLQARVATLFDQGTWGGEWMDERLGDAAAAAEYDAINHPVSVTNAGGYTERWVLQFLSASEVRVIGEHLGNLGRFLIANPIEPVNSATGQPYFSIPSDGWGDGWSVGDVLRFNTVGAVGAAWLIRAVQPGPGTQDDDSISLLPRGDAA